MLILERRVGEKIIIDHPDLDENIIVEVYSTAHDRTRIGITAPLAALVDREEIYLSRPEADA